MNRKRSIFLALVLTFTVGILLSSCDPRKNCNHPEHGKYMQEKISKKRGLPR